MDEYKILIEKAQKLHGELCPGVIIGTRMSIAAMKKLGMDPLEENDHLIVYVETDRCMPDAVEAITGCTVGRRTLKFRNHGKFVATFIDMKTGKAVRVSAKDDKISSYPGLWNWFDTIIELRKNGKMKDVMGEKKATIKKLSQMPDEELLNLEDVEFEVPKNEIPSMPDHMVICSVCGEHVMDQKELTVNGAHICRACAHELFKLQ